MVDRVILGVDFGTSNTVAVLGVSGRPSIRLMFDGSMILPSGVYAVDRDTLLTGRDAVQAAQTQPERYLAHPKTKISNDHILLGTVEVPAVDLIAAVFARIWEVAVHTAQSMLGDQHITETVIAYPDTWKAGRVAILEAAAKKVGMVKPRLVKEPIAAAEQLNNKPQPALREDRAIVVYDLGAGTFDASIVKREKSGFRVLQSSGLNGVAGLALDHAIREHLASVVARTDLAAANRIEHPQTRNDLRIAKQFMDTIRLARESLSTQMSVNIHFPHHEDDLVLTRATFEGIARPILQSTVDSVLDLISDAALTKTDIGPVVLIGGASRTPLVTDLLKEEFHRSPIPMLNPEQAVAEGSITVQAIKGVTKPQSVAVRRREPDPRPPAPPPEPTPEQEREPGPRSGTRPLMIAGATIGVVVLMAATAALVQWQPWNNVETGPTLPSSSVAPIPGDGVLTIAGLLPQTGTIAEIGEGLYSAYDLAINDINDAGGVLGRDVVSLRSDSTDDGEKAKAAVDVLLENNADVFIGTTSSALTLKVIDKITGAGKVEISPANTALRLTSYKDNGLYFRTAPPDTFQGAVLADLVVRDGKRKAAMFVRGDEYGKGLAAVVQVALSKNNVTVVRADYDPADTDLTQEVAQIKAQAPDAIIMIGFDETKLIVAELVKSGITVKNTNWYMVDGNFADYSASLPPGTMEGAKATQPGAPVTDEFRARLITLKPQLKNFAYGPESYDATILAALAAQEAGSDHPAEIAKHLISVSRDGQKCTTFKDCKELLADGKNIDYEGLSGAVNFNADGDPTEASTGVFIYRADNTATNLRYVSKIL